MDKMASNRVSKLVKNSFTLQITATQLSSCACITILNFSCSNILFMVIWAFIFHFDILFHHFLFSFLDFQFQELVTLSLCCLSRAADERKRFTAFLVISMHDTITDSRICRICGVFPHLLVSIRIHTSLVFLNN